MARAARDRRGRLRSARRRGAAAAVLAAALAAAPAGAAGAAAKPERIVSVNVCADQLVLMLAERRRIASLSRLAADPEVSAMSRAASGLPRNHGQAEEILPLDPDVVVAGAFSARAAASLLRRLGYRVVEVPVATALDDVARNVALVAEAVGEAAKGRALIREFEAEIAAVRRRADPGSPAPLAALYWANGYGSGPGTLANALVEAAGFRTLGRRLGIAGTGILPLETLVAAAPDVLILGRLRGGAALAGAALDHPALARGLAGAARAALPDKLWLCGTPPAAVSILRRLARLRAEVARDRAP